MVGAASRVLGNGTLERDSRAFLFVHEEGCSGSQVQVGDRAGVHQDRPARTDPTKASQGTRRPVRGPQVVRKDAPEASRGVARRLGRVRLAAR